MMIIVHDDVGVTDQELMRIHQGGGTDHRINSGNCGQSDSYYGIGGMNNNQQPRDHFNATTPKTCVDGRKNSYLSSDVRFQINEHSMQQRLPSSGIDQSALVKRFTIKNIALQNKDTEKLVKRQLEGFMNLQALQTETIARNISGENEDEPLDVTESAKSIQGGEFSGTNKDFEGFETPRGSARNKSQSRNGQGQTGQDMSNLLNERQLSQVKREDSNGSNTIIAEGPDNVNETQPISETVINSPYDRKSLFLIPINSKFRQRLIQIVDSKIFEYLMVFIIVLNSITLALYDYNDRDSTHMFNQINDQINIFFTSVFILEAVLKILAKGFIIHPESYLRNGWNLIDSIVVISGILELSFGSVKLKSLRVFRVFRPFKSINVMPNMKKLIQTLMQSLPEFGNVGAFLVYVFILFATMGLHQYNGSTYNLCRYHKDPENSTIWAWDPTQQRVCSQSQLGTYICPGDLYCGNNDEHPEIDFNSDQIDRRSYINYGITNFDNLATSLLTVFQIINSDSWYTYLINMMDVDIPVFGGIYCIVMIVIGQFFLMNLILAVIIFAFIKTQKKELEGEIQQLNEAEISENQPSSPSKEPDTSKNKQHELEESPKTPGLGLHRQPLNKDQDFGECAIDQANKHGEFLRSGQKPQNEDDAELGMFLKPHAQKVKIANLLKSNREEHSNLGSGIIPEIEAHHLDQLKRNETAGMLLAAKQITIHPDDVDKARSQSAKDLSFSSNFIKGGKIQGSSDDNNSSSPKQQAPSLLMQGTLAQQTLIPMQKMPSVIMEEEQSESVHSKDRQGLNLSSAVANPNDLMINDKNLDNSYTKLLEPPNIEDLKVDFAPIKEEEEQIEPKVIIVEVEKEPEKPQQSLGQLLRMLRDQKLEAERKARDEAERLHADVIRSESPTIGKFNGVLPMSEISAQSASKGNDQQQKNGLASLFGKGLLLKSAGNYEEEEDEGGQRLLRLFKRCLKQKIEQQYHIYFKAILKDAKENFTGGNTDAYVNKTNLRELVGLKVGLEFIKLEETQKKEQENFHKIEERSRKHKIYTWAYNLSESQFFLVFMTISIIINTLVLALDRYPVDLNETNVTEKINILFTLIFTLEMLIKMVAVGIVNYFKGSAFNVFDSVIVFSSMIDIFLSNFIMTDKNENSGSVITALRGFRLLRVFKLAQSWKRLELLLETLGRTLMDIATFSVLLFLFIFTFTLLGLEMFAHRAKLDFKKDLVDLENGQSPLFNFDNFLNSFTTVFVVLTNDAMSEIYYNHYRTVGAFSSTIFFVLLVIIGQKILLNLFLAILLENFDESALKHKMHEFEQNQQEVNQEKKHIGPPSIQKRLAFLYRYLKRQIIKCFKKMMKKSEEEDVDDLTDQNKSILLKNLRIFGGKNNNIQKQISKMVISQNTDQPILEGVSLNLITVDNKFRQFLFKLVTHDKFDFFIILFIIISAIQLALDSPIENPESTLKQSLFWIDLGTTIVFILESILKIIAFGFVLNGPRSYLRNNWNMIDFTIIVFSILSLTPLSDSLRAIKMFRILRLLRLISKNEELKVAVRALFLAIPNVANVTIIMLLFFLIFGVILISYFKGKLYYCNGALSPVLNDQVTKWDCLSAGGNWKNQIYNFDNAINALVTLFVLSTTAGWALVMSQCIQSTEIDLLPNPNAENSFIWIIFFVIFIIVGAFFFLNLFVGVVISTFNSEHDKLGGNDLLTEKQKEWIDLRLLVLRSSPQRKLKAPERSKFRTFFFKIQDNHYFENFIMIIIVLNTLVLFLKWYEQPKEVDQVAEILNYIFTAIFFTEAIIRIIAISPKLYFSEGWNIFDFVIVLGSFLSIFVSANTSLEIRGAITIMRSFRILRLLRLIKRGKSLQLIFNTLLITLHSLANIGALLLLFIFMFSILGMILFGNVMRNGLMNDLINFESFINAYLTLFVVATGDSWNDIMRAFTIENSPDTPCLDNPTYQDYVEIGNHSNVGCGSLILSQSYFVSYMFVVNLIFLKIFIAIILQGYNDTQTQDGRLFNHDMNDRFREVWTQFDPDATNFIPLHQLRPFLFALGEPLGFDFSYKNRRLMQDQFIASLELPTYHNFSSYQFLDVLDALSFRLMVLDHMKKIKKEDAHFIRQMTAASMNNLITKEMEKDLRQELQKEINKLIFQKSSEAITAVKEVSEKETKRVQKKQKQRDQTGLTSQHHMAAEATVRKFRLFIKIRRGERSSWGTDSSFDKSDNAQIGQQNLQSEMGGTGMIERPQINIQQMGTILSNGSQIRRANYLGKASIRSRKYNNIKSKPSSRFSGVLQQTQPLRMNEEIKDMDQVEEEEKVNVLSGRGEDSQRPLHYQTLASVQQANKISNSNPTLNPIPVATTPIHNKVQPSPRVSLAPSSNKPIKSILRKAEDSSFGQHHHHHHHHKHQNKHSKFNSKQQQNQGDKGKNNVPQQRGQFFSNNDLQIAKSSQFDNYSLKPSENTSAYEGENIRIAGSSIFPQGTKTKHNLGINHQKSFARSCSLLDAGGALLKQAPSDGTKEQRAFNKTGAPKHRRPLDNHIDAEEVYQKAQSHDKHPVKNMLTENPALQNKERKEQRKQQPIQLDQISISLNDEEGSSANNKVKEE